MAAIANLNPLTPAETSLWQCPMEFLASDSAMNVAVDQEDNKDRRPTQTSGCLLRLGMGFGQVLQEREWR